MSYRSKISVNPNINVQGLQSSIQANIHDLIQIQIDNDVFSSIYNNRTLTLFNNKSINGSTNLAANSINTLYLEPTQQISFFGGVSHADMVIRIDISNDNTNFFDANQPVVLNSSNDFSINYHTQAPFIRIRVFNPLGSVQTIEKIFASYKFKNIKGKDNSVNVLDANQSFVTVT